MRMAEEPRAHGLLVAREYGLQEKAFPVSLVAHVSEDQASKSLCLLQ